MTSASVTLHESNLSVRSGSPGPCVHHGKVMRHWKPDEWRITCAFTKAGGLCAIASEAVRALPAMPTASPGRRHHLRQHSPRPLAPLSPEAGDSRQKRNRSQQMGPLTLAGPSEHCVLVTCHLLLFFWSDNTSRQGFSVFGGDTKGKGNGERKSWRGLPLLLLKFSERADTKRGTSLRTNKGRAPPAPQKPAMHPYSSSQRSPYKTPRVREHRNLCKESACTKAICNFTKWQT